MLNCHTIPTITTTIQGVIFVSNPINQYDSWVVYGRFITPFTHQTDFSPNLVLLFLSADYLSHALCLSLECLNLNVSLPILCSMCLAPHTITMEDSFGCILVHSSAFYSTRLSFYIPKVDHQIQQQLAYHTCDLVNNLNHLCYATLDTIASLSSRARSAAKPSPWTVESSLSAERPHTGWALLEEIQPAETIGLFQTNSSRLSFYVTFYLF